MGGKMKFKELKLSSWMDQYREYVTSHTFEIIEVGRIEGGGRFKCAFCGGIGHNYVLIKRDDGLKLKVGQTCLKRVGLHVVEGTKVIKKEMKKENGAQKKYEQRLAAAVAKKAGRRREGPKVEINRKKEKSPEFSEALDKILEDL